MLSQNHTPSQKIEHPLFQDNGVELWVKRLDLISEDASGNKFFKLKYNLEEAKRQGYSQILTFGGAYSNHIFATAKACEKEGLSSIGIIRGEETLPLNPTLSQAKEFGMKLCYVDRESYRKKTEPSFLEKLKKQWGESYMIPEGGTNSLAIQGTKDILSKEDKSFDNLATSIGTGGTFTGLALSKNPNQTLLGFSSLKGDFIHREIDQVFNSIRETRPEKTIILDQFHFGGYGKIKPELIDFIHEIYQKYQLPLDPIYTGKALLGLFKLCQDGYFEAGKRILFIHTGGLQGNAGFSQRMGIKLPLSE